jgi:hypothetical protein
VHTNSYAQDSSTERGPLVTDNITIDYASLADSDKRKHFIMDPIGLLYSEDGKTIWGSSFTSIFRLDRSASNFKIIAQRDNGVIDNIENYRMHGAYSLIAKVNGEEQFIIAKRNAASVFRAAPSGDIEAIRSHIITAVQEDDRLIGLSLTYDGWLIYVTKKGWVGALTLDFSREIPPIKLPGDQSLDISNSFAIDANGGIYIVSSQFMQRVNWDPASETLKLAWNTPYDTGDPIPQPGRLGAGSGSTPSLMGNATDGWYVVITDGAKLMNIDVFDAETGVLLASAPVNFGDPSIQKVTSEQSVLVSDWRAVVVNNQYKSKHPILLGEAPMGIQQFRFDPVTKTLTSTWHINHISVPNGIPTMSQTSRMMYAIAKKQLSTKKISAWGLVGIDWDTGKEVFFKEAGTGLKYNSAYAATEVGLDGEILSGTALGIVRFRINK